MAHGEAEPTAYRSTAIAGLALLSGSFLAFAIVYLLLLLPVTNININVFAVQVAFPVVTLAFLVMTIIGLAGDVSSRRRDREQSLSEYRAMLGMPQHVWRISTFLVVEPLLWAASVVTAALQFQYTDTSSGSPLIPKPDLFAANLNVDATTINGLFNVRYMFTMILLLFFCGAQFFLVGYTFLTYSLTPFLPVRGNQIKLWAKFEGLVFGKGTAKES